jgi:hypothetical protein
MKSTIGRIVMEDTHEHCECVADETPWTAKDVVVVAAGTAFFCWSAYQVGRVINDGATMGISAIRSKLNERKSRKTSAVEN